MHIASSPSAAGALTTPRPAARPQASRTPPFPPAAANTGLSTASSASTPTPAVAAAVAPSSPAAGWSTAQFAHQVSGRPEKSADPSAGRGSGDRVGPTEVPTAGAASPGASTATSTSTNGVDSSSSDDSDTEVHAAVAQLMDQLDTNGDGQIGFDELATFAEQILANPPAPTANVNIHISLSGAGGTTLSSTTSASSSSAGSSAAPSASSGPQASHHYQALAAAGQDTAAAGQIPPARSSVSLSA